MKRPNIDKFLNQMKGFFEANGEIDPPPPPHFINIGQSLGFDWTGAGSQIKQINQCLDLFRTMFQKVR